MSICIVDNCDNYITMSSYHIKDKNLSLKAKGLLSLILILPNRENFNIKNLAAICKENETAIKSALEELKENGYLVVTKIKPCIENGGKWSYKYTFYEHPNSIK